MSRNFTWRGMSEDGQSVVLKKLDISRDLLIPDYATPEWVSKNTDKLMTASILDTETTGFDSRDHIIEISVQQVLVNKESGEIVALKENYLSYNEPPIEIPEVITKITGITKEMVLGKSIDWDKVNSMFEESSLIIAHNAKFDRGFVDRKSQVSSNKIWGCSQSQVDWQSKGFPSAKLELLSVHHGFFVDAHNAKSDTDALTYLLSIKDDKTGVPYLKEVMEMIKKPSVQLIATASSYNYKDLLKGRGYMWDNDNKFWFKVILKEALAEEETWLTDNIYMGEYQGTVRNIKPNQMFK